MLLVHPRATRNDLGGIVLAKATRDRLEPVAPAPDDAAPPAAPPPRSASPTWTPPPRRARAAAPTMPIPPSESQRMAEACRLDARGPTAIGTPPPHAGPMPTVPAAPDASPGRRPGVIYARYLRSGRWVPVRVGALSLKGAALMTGALPRLFDQVDLAIAFGRHRALVRGPVHKLSTEQEAALSGASTFSVKFELDDNARRQLTALLTAARAANVTIKPPPARQERRFAVDWPVCLGTTRGAVRGEALDLSREGMFVRPARGLALDASLSFSVVLDDDDAPISGRARVVRHVDEHHARLCGVGAGYGLRIVDMGAADRDRWAGFLARIERRSQRRVMIGAAPARLAELQAGLAASGYAIVGAADPGALVQLASAEGRPVDAAVVDAAWLTPSTASIVESLFSARGVPCVTLTGDVRSARARLDRAFHVF